MSEGAAPAVLDASGMRVAVVYAEFNAGLTKGLLDGAIDYLAEADADYTVTTVLGSFELPVVSLRAARSGFDAVVALGAVVQGETDHYDHIAHRASEGLMRVSLDTGVPVAFGVLTATDPQHVADRAAPGPHNKGREAAAAAVRAVLAGREIEATAPARTVD